MRRHRPVAGYRPPAERIAALKAELAEERDLARRLRVLAAVMQYAHPNPPLPVAAPPPRRPVVRRGPRVPCPKPLAAPTVVPSQREPEPVEIWAQRKGVRVPPASMLKPRRGGQP